MCLMLPHSPHAPICSLDTPTPVSWVHGAPKVYRALHGERWCRRGDDGVGSSLQTKGTPTGTTCVGTLSLLHQGPCRGRGFGDRPQGPGSSGEKANMRVCCP